MMKGTSFVVDKALIVSNLVLSYNVHMCCGLDASQSSSRAFEIEKEK